MKLFLPEERYCIHELSAVQLITIYNNTTEEWKKDIFKTIIEWQSGNDVEITTSGSTGTPKAIKLSHESMRLSAVKTGAYFNLRKGQNAYLCLPAKFIAGKMMIVRALVLDLDLIVDKPSGSPLNDINQSIDFVAMTPMQMQNTIELASEKIKFLNTVILGGAPVNHHLQEKLNTLDCQCYLTYGMTETITHIAVKQLNGTDKTNFFTILPGIKISKSINDTLTIDADHLPEIIKTTDIVELIDKDRFRWLGRKDNVINSGGLKLSPEVLEQKLGVLPVRYLITSQPDDLLGQRVVLIAEQTSKDEALIAQIKNQIEAQLNKLEQPKKIYFVSKLKETATGKRKRQWKLYESVSFSID